MAATETDTAPVVQDDGKSAESKTTEAEQPARTVHSETVENDGAAENKETVDNDTAAAEEGGEGAVASEEAAPPQENASSAEPKPSLLDSFLNKSGLGKVMAGRKKKELSSAAAAGDENATEGGEKEGEKGAEEGEEAEGETAPENGEEEEKKAEKAKGAEPKSTVRDLIRKPVARIFSHRSTEKKDGTPAEPQKPVKVRSKSLDRLEDPEALNAMADAAAAEEGGAAGGVEEEQKASAATKHMRRWHSFKKMMAQKTHKKSGGEDKEEGPEGDGGGRDSSTLDSKDSAQQKRWKLKRSWTFQGLKRDSSIVGISGKSKTEETAEGGEEGKEEGGAKADGEEEKEKGDGGEEEKAAGGGTVTQHANEIWTSFKKRVIPKSKRANTECAPGGEEDAAAAASGEEPAEDGKSAKAKRSHFGRAVSLKNFIMRKGKSTSVDLGEGAKEEEEGAGAGGAEGGASATPAEEANDNDAVAAEEKTEAETPSKTAVTNGENGCSNGTAEAEHATNNHQEEEKSAGSPVKKVKEAGAKDDGHAKIINATAAVNSGELEPDGGGGDEDDNHRRLQMLTNTSRKLACRQPELARAGSGVEGEEVVGAESHDRAGQGDDDDEEQMKKRELRDAAVAIVQNVMSAAADQLEREMCTNNGLNGCYYGDM